MLEAEHVDEKRHLIVGAALLSTTWLILVGRERSRTTSGCCARSDEMLIGRPSGLSKRKP